MPATQPAAVRRGHRRQGQRQPAHDVVGVGEVAEALGVVPGADEVVDETHHGSRRGRRPRVAAEQGRELGDGVSPRPRGGRVGGDAVGPDADDVAVAIDLEPAGLGPGGVAVERGRQPLVGAGDDRLGETRHLREIAAAGERRQPGRPSGAPRAVAQGDADRPGAELAGDDGIQGVERDVEGRRGPPGEELAERGPVGLFGERHDQLDAAAPGEALVAERLQAVERGGDGPLVVLDPAPEQAAGLGVAVEGERIGLPGRRVGGAHVGVGQDAEAVGRPAGPQHQGRPRSPRSPAPAGPRRRRDSP